MSRYLHFSILISTIQLPKITTIYCYNTIGTYALFYFLTNYQLMIINYNPFASMEIFKIRILLKEVKGFLKA